MMNKKEYKKLEEVLIQVGLKIAKRGEGALFVVGKTEYKPMVNQNIPPFKAIENPKLLESLALMDGAVIIDSGGMVEAYGAMVKSKKTFKNFGTRHSAGLSASKGNNLSIVISEEDRKLRILKNEKLIMQIDALQKNVEKSVPHAVNLLESVGIGTLGTIGTSLLVPSLGIALIPGIILFGSAYFIGKVMRKKI
ncbi:MAG: DNA integrity scanning protein DisA nucleotide-binding domain protein [Nanoarchaeota archaeon]|nr:DNA integrity scanning protein DisA nucleotide-binding domain protein [Nanoarchaeota archaeon]